MKGICPNCEKETDIKRIRTTEEIKVRGEPIRVDVEYYKCLSCGEEFEDPHSNDDPLDKAYKEYRKRYGMMQPEEIRNLRKRYGLTQAEMATILGWGAITLSRYENGALQDEAHEKLLRLAEDPRNLSRLIEETPEALLAEKRQHLVEKLRVAEYEAYSLERIYEERFGKYEADEFSGFTTFDLSKLINAILFFCEEGVLKTVLNKLLFYADFKHFKDNVTSISGVRYAKISFGPAPDKWQHYFTLLIDEGALISDEIFYNEDVTGEKLISKKSPDLNVFSDTELITLISVRKSFRGWPAKRISEFSHNEEGYKNTLQGRFISYNYAKDLQLE
jgi:putative zinc finger/helix-turn-helix YgiT family protein